MPQMLFILKFSEAEFHHTDGAWCVLPTSDDLKEGQQISLYPNVTKGSYKDTYHYLDVQFRLLREDFIRPLRKGIIEFKDSGFKKHFISSDLRLYYDVHILGMIQIDGIDHVLQFDTSGLKTVRWDISKRLIFGSLVCISKDGFKTMAIATISRSNPKDLKKGLVNVNFRSGLEIVFSSTPNDEFVMAETVAYYEAYCHVLEGLQEMIQHLPLQRHIVFCEKTVKPPKYMLRASRNPQYNLHPLMKDNASVIVPVLTATKWPSSNKMSLNWSQREAVQMALTKKLAVIQGPPGTGKTYVGLKVVHTLLENHNAWALTKTKLKRHVKNSPILIVCYTNHALDQFLEGILQFCTNGLIRVGGRSKSEKLADFNLKVLKRSGRFRSANKSLRESRKECQINLDRLINQLKETSEELEATTFAIRSVSKLKQFISEVHMKSLFICDETGYSLDDSFLGHWLNARVEDPSESVTNLIERSMTRLILTGDTQPFEYEVTEQMSVQKRAAVYLFYVKKLESSLPEIALQNVFETEDIYRTLRICKTDIVTDGDMNMVMELEVFLKIQNSLGKYQKYFPNENVKAWLLGLHKSQHAQLDDIEQLLGKMSGPDAGSLAEVEYFFNQQDTTDDYLDDEFDMAYLKQTFALKNSFTSIMKRIAALKLEERLEIKSADDEGWQSVRTCLNLAKIYRMINTTEPMTDEQAALIQDVWALNMNERFALYKLWIERYKATLLEETKLILDEYKSVLSDKSRINNEETVSILKEASIIGMTTSCAAKYRSVLQAVACRIIVVEEAAEVLEAHIVTALNKDCEHLILIGDHQQLRPNPCVYELAKDYGLDISLFERLVVNQFPHVVLQEQHRMRPEISKLMRHIYPNLKDHSCVTHYDHIKGVTKDIFFVQHEEPETSVGDTYSKANEFEAKYVTKMCKYFLHQGYEPSQVTILTTYAGQVSSIMKTLPFKSPVRATTVDNFQGEENDIIILSLVRSNEKNRVGFLKVENRVCVALSRAKKGLFVVGNLELLSSQSKLWNKILDTARLGGSVGNGLPVVCQNHPEKKPVLMFSPEDFDSRPEGGCGVPCQYILPCKHKCRLKCHGYDRHHESYLCKEPCIRSCIRGHRCQKECFEDCGDCTVRVLKLIPNCGHEDMVPCYLPAEDAKCNQLCEEILDDCGHMCSGRCGQCKLNSEHPPCKRRVYYTWPCGHSVQVECYQRPDLFPCPHPCDAILECGHRCNGTCGSCVAGKDHTDCGAAFEEMSHFYPCPHPCDAVLECGHKCKGTCGSCLQGKVHIACGERCGKMLPCGHLCPNHCSAPCTPCLKPCPSQCRHRACYKSRKSPEVKCGHICIPCHEDCIRGCRCKKCPNLCSDICSKAPCNKACKRKVNGCGHSCSGLCGEICVCDSCSKVEVLKLTHEPESQSICASLAGEIPDVKENAEIVTSNLQSKDKKSEGMNSVDRAYEETAKTESAAKADSPHLSKRRLVKIPECYHVFYVDELDEYINNFDPDGSRYIPCPTCQWPIQKCTRYEHINIERAERRNQLKRCLIAEYLCSESDKVALSDSQKVLADSELMAAFKTIDLNGVRSKAEVMALSFKFKLAFILSEIQAFELSDGHSSEFISTRKEAFLKIAGHVTPQQKREFISDLAGGLIHAVIFKVKGSNMKTSQYFTAVRDDLTKDCDIKGNFDNKTEIIDRLQHAMDSFIVSTSIAMSAPAPYWRMGIKRRVRDVCTVLRSDDSQEEEKEQEEEVEDDDYDEDEEEDDRVEGGGRVGKEKDDDDDDDEENCPFYITSLSERDRTFINGRPCN
ncbi:nfx1-type Zinc finger-containing protein 1-like [Plakobranchus ocellatus]|uniref:Nfx1-type Zinc finger-containing protein 1-like n=1 Tax=Plakobranchus ocellatus TaxID=259542 RepID=A0AAV3YSF7_9GAST|nr:nfx1-type Zinc finger-containing protein 1-like [Plakobranchus ocellatus]